MDKHDITDAYSEMTYSTSSYTYMQYIYQPFAYDDAFSQHGFHFVPD